MIISYSWKHVSSFYNKQKKGSSSFSLSAFRPSNREFDIESLRGTAISDFWIEQLKLVDRPMAVNAIKYLYSKSPMGFATTKTTKVAFEFQEKRKREEFKDKIFLIRLGDFYETYGIDALMIANYCGVNFMKTGDMSLKAGVPWRNIQPTLDGLTDAGLSIAVFEQLKNNDADKGPSQSTVSKSTSSTAKKGKGKTSKNGGTTTSTTSTTTTTTTTTLTRFLSKIVHPGSRIYSYDLSLRTDNIDYQLNNPFWGIIKSGANGYQVYEVYQDEEIIIPHDRMTKEAVLTLYHEHGCVEPIYIDTKTMTASELSFLPHTVSLSGYNEKQFLEQLLRRLQTDFGITKEQISRFQYQPTVITNRPRSLYTSTAQQIGLLDDKNVPNLVPHLLPKGHSAHSARFLKKWLLHPPPFELAIHMQHLCQHLSELDISLPQNVPIPIGKIRSLLDARECSAAMFDDILVNVKGVLTILDAAAAETEGKGDGVSNNTAGNNDTSSNNNGIGGSSERTDNSSSDNSQQQQQQHEQPYKKLIDSLLPIVRFESALPTDAVPLREGCRRIVEHIEAVIATDNDSLNNEESFDQWMMSGMSGSGENGNIGTDDTNEDEDGDGEDEGEAIETTAEMVEADESISSNINSFTNDNNDINIATNNNRQQQHDVPSTDPTGRVPAEFFVRNEQHFRGKMSMSHPVIQQLYHEIDVAAKNLSHVINTQFPSAITTATTKSQQQSQVIRFDDDIMNNVIGIKLPIKLSTPSKVTITTKDELKSYLHKLTNDNNTIDIETVIVRDGNSKRQKAMTKKTTPQVQEAMDIYLDKTEEAEAVIKKILQDLCESLLPDMISLVQSAHWAVILSAAHSHTKSAKQKGWILPELENDNNSSGSIAQQQQQQPKGRTSINTNSNSNNNKHININTNSNTNTNTNTQQNFKKDMFVAGLTPYWMNRDDSAISNDIHLNGMFLLTAPNMSGKSTLMRSTMVVALLANCGLCVPATTAYVPRYDNYFMRTSSHDIPSEGKSAYALEMDDMRVLLRDCTAKSIIMVDELGKGTSARDGAAVAGALLEHWDDLGCSGVFATHLHEVFQLPLNFNKGRIQYKRIGLDANNKWTYKLEDGICTDSMALVTASEYNIPYSIIRRAERLQMDFDRICRSDNNGGGGSRVRDGIANIATTIITTARVGNEDVGGDMSISSDITDIVVPVPITVDIIKTDTETEMNITTATVNIAALHTNLNITNTSYSNLSSVDDVSIITSAYDISTTATTSTTTSDESVPSFSTMMMTTFSSSISSSLLAIDEVPLFSTLATTNSATHVEENNHNHDITDRSSFITTASAIKETIHPSFHPSSLPLIDSKSSNNSTADMIRTAVAKINGYEYNNGTLVKPTSPQISALVMIQPMTATSYPPNEDHTNITAPLSSVAEVVVAPVPVVVNKKRSLKKAMNVTTIDTTDDGVDSQLAAIKTSLSFAELNDEEDDDIGVNAITSGVTDTVAITRQNNFNNDYVPEVEAVTSSINTSSSTIYTDVNSMIVNVTTAINSSITLGESDRTTVDISNSTNAATIITSNPLSSSSFDTALSQISQQQQQQQSSFQSFLSLRSYSLEALEPIIKTHSGTRKVYIIEPMYIPPLTLDGQSCVYILHIKSKSQSQTNSASSSGIGSSNSASSSGSGAEWLYVGETESISQRLNQHRRTYKDAIVRAAVVAAPNKSAARYLETKLIGRFKQEGYAMGRTGDERHTQFGSATAVFNNDRNNSSGATHIST